VGHESWLTPTQFGSPPGILRTVPAVPIKSNPAKPQVNASTHPKNQKKSETGTITPDFSNPLRKWEFLTSVTLP
jgi:hypothetical protein